MYCLKVLHSKCSPTTGELTWRSSSSEGTPVHFVIKIIIRSVTENSEFRPRILQSIRRRKNWHSLHQPVDHSSSNKQMRQCWWWLQVLFPICTPRTVRELKTTSSSFPHFVHWSVSAPLTPIYQGRSPSKTKRPWRKTSTMLPVASAGNYHNISKPSLCSFTERSIRLHRKRNLLLEWDPYHQRQSSKLCRVINSSSSEY